MKMNLDLDEAVDPVRFARHRLGFHPDPAQAAVLSRGIPRGLLNCARQWGKSTVTAIKALHQALFEPDSLTLVLSPTARQSAEFVRKAAGLLRKLDIDAPGDGDNAISLAFPTAPASSASPGNEDTIRGFSAVRLLLIDDG